MQNPTTPKPTSKISRVLPSNYHLPVRKYAGHIYIGGDNHWTPWYDSKEEATLELRCLEKRLSFEVIETVEDEGMYPERAKVVEEKYQASGRNDGLYTGLITEDGPILNDTP
jgi:hypothetical protein